jgi:alkanesulfonate monooxygenase SsuD/methylene tetrahydromethanopterin reductase-like flavin-dependent oxidoreductase (luciferase family)
MSYWRCGGSWTGTAFESLWLMDHFVTGFGTAFGSEGPCLEGWSALAALAQATSRVRMGIMVTGNTYRHPAVLAKQATTVDHVSGGRLDFGIGAAWHTYEHEAFAIPFHTVKERLERLEESVQVIKLLWTEPLPKFDGAYYRLNAPPYNPPSVQQPHHRS